MGPLTLLLLLTLVLWAAGFILAPKLRRLRNRAACLPPAVSVIIPARNEAHNLPALLGSLAAQPVSLHEVIVVDDGSTDQTARLARDHGARVLASLALPEGWRGKTWACQQGAQAATGNLLLFLDADTWFEPDGLPRILSAYQGGALSVGPYHLVRKLYEDFSLFFNFNMTMGTVPHGLFGQMLLVDRESYWRVGGHQVVSGRTLENFRLAECFHAGGIKVQSLNGRGLFSFRMYPHGLRQLAEGWAKGFASGTGRTPRATLGLIVAWMIGLMLAWLGLLLTGDWLWWGAVYLLSAVQVAWFARQLGSFRWTSALLYPVPLLFFFVLFAWSVTRVGRPVMWKGRAIRAD